MALQHGLISPLKYLSADVEMEPVYLALNSLALLNVTAQLPDLPNWVKRTVQALTPERRQIHRLVFEGLGALLTPDQMYLDFPAYLESFAETDPVVLRERFLTRLVQALPGPLEYGGAAVPVDTDVLLSEPQAYLAHIKLLNPLLEIDTKLQQQVYQLLLAPEKLQDALVSHLRLMWKAILAPEWKRVEHTLQSQTIVYKECLDLSATTQELFRFYTGRDLLKLFPLRRMDIERVILLPSPHNGRYVTQWFSEGVLRLFFSSPNNFSLASRPATMGTPELHARLKALADTLVDETRLHILELFIQHDRLSAQELMERLDVSQSSVSRHLKQLVQAGYLLEKREGANKLYTFDVLSFDSTIRALELLKAGATVEENSRPDPRETLPRELKRLVDVQGRVTLWPPPKLRDRRIILEYLIDKFDLGQIYTEKEINELLAQYITFQDVASLRRELFEYKLLERVADDEQYRRRTW